MLPRSQLKLGPPPTSTQLVPAAGVIAPRVNPPGHVSLRLTPVTSDGPALETVMVYVRVMPSPAVTVEPPSSIVTDRSALAPTALTSLSLLFPPVGSLTALVTLTELVSVPDGVETGTM